MQDCDYSSGCVDVYLWIGLTIIILLISFLFCCRICRIVPLICGNEIELCFRGSKDHPTESANAANSTPLPSADHVNPASAKADQTTDVRIQISSSNNTHESPSPQPSLLAKTGARFLCSIAFGYIIAIIIIAIIVSMTTPFPSVPASACRATCAATDANCCTYNPPLAHDDVYFSMADGTQLHGWWIPSPNGGNATLLYNHGSGQNIAVMYRILRYQVRMNRGARPIPALTRPWRRESTGEQSFDGTRPGSAA
jgi:hypothetical protein